MDAVFAACRVMGAGCTFAIAAVIASNRAICASVPALSGSSAVAMCVKQPVSSMPGRLSMSVASAAASSGLRTPMRHMPVSSLMCTCAVLCSLTPASLSARTRDSSKTTCVRPAETTASAADSSMPPSTRMGAVMPAVRSSIPSSGMATASICAPAESAALATGTAPCP